MCNPPSRLPAVRRPAPAPAPAPAPLRLGDRIRVVVRDPDDPSRLLLVTARVVPRRR